MDSVFRALWLATHLVNIMHYSLIHLQFLRVRRLLPDRSLTVPLYKRNSGSRDEIALSDFRIHVFVVVVVVGLFPLIYLFISIHCSYCSQFALNLVNRFITVWANHLAPGDYVEIWRSRLDQPERANLYKNQNIVYIIQRRAYEGMFMSLFMPRPERARSERGRTFDTNKEWI